jgi:hydrogenase expression/formation protein HypC
MCLAIPSKIIKIEDSKATVDVYGAQRDISLMLLEEPVNIGDYVIVHAGFAIQKLQEDIAKETLSLFNQYLAAEENIAGGTLQDSPQKIRKRPKKKM